MEGLPITKPTASFLGIPLEIRQEIYRYLLVKPWVISLGGDSDFRPLSEVYMREYRTRWTAILRTSRQLNIEALDVLYGENDFGMLLDPDGDVGTVSEAFRLDISQRLRRLTVLARHRDPHGRPPQYLLNMQMLLPVVANLTSLDIIAVQPLPPSEPQQSVGTEMWRTWLQTLFEHINTRAKKSLTVGLDVDGEKETYELAVECLTNLRVRQLEAETGHVVFRRGLAAILDMDPGGFAILMSRLTCGRRASVVNRLNCETLGWGYNREDWTGN